MKILPYLFTFFLLSSCTAQPAEKLKTNADDNTLLWEIFGPRLAGPSYLFGTFHLMCMEDIRFSNELKQALSMTPEVYFEMDLDDPANTLGAMLFINMKEGKTLKDLYQADEYARLERFYKDSLGMPLSSLNRMKPGVMEAVLYPKLLPCRNLSGVEMEILKIATVQKKEIRGFENMEIQASLFDSIPYEIQAKELLKTIDRFNVYRENFDSLLTVYKNQQLMAIEKLFSKSEFGMDENRDILLDNRNRNWVEQLNKILPSKNIFIAVGAGHLVGEKGLISLLRKEGYTLRPLLNK